MPNLEPSNSRGPIWDIIQPFIDIVRAPRALWGVNVGYFLEGFIYFGMLSYLAMFFNQYVGLDDIRAGWMVGTLTAGITISMFFFGGLSDRWGIRFALIAAFVFLLAGRVLIASGPTLGLPADGLGSTIHVVSLAGILLIVLGYGMYQPASYAAVRQFTTAKTATMGFAMLYALMNLGGWLPTFFGPIRRAYGISGAFWVYTALTGLALLFTTLLLTKRTVTAAIRAAKPQPSRAEVIGADGLISIDFECRSCSYNLRTMSTSAACPECGAAVMESVQRIGEAARKDPFSLWEWIRTHPLGDPKFTFFIFCLIPVQTLFAHNWLTLPMYVERAFRDSWIGANFEVAANFNPLLTFVLVPIVAALTQMANVYRMMILGTGIMALPTFLLALGPHPALLLLYLVIMTVGEAMWQPRFLQYAAEIAPEGKTGAYMGVAQLPWFLTKMIVPLYSGWFLQRYCPDEGPIQSERMWLIYGLIAMCSTVLLLLSRNWLGKDFKTKADAAGQAGGTPPAPVPRICAACRTENREAAGYCAQCGRALS